MRVFPVFLRSKKHEPFASEEKSRQKRKGVRLRTPFLVYGGEEGRTGFRSQTSCLLPPPNLRSLPAPSMAPLPPYSVGAHYAEFNSPQIQIKKTRLLY